MTRNSCLLAALLVLSAPHCVRAFDGQAGVSAEAILEMTLREPKFSFHGHAVTIRWFGGRTRAQEFNIDYKPTGRYRREYLSPDGKIESTTVSDGSMEYIHFARKKNTLSGDAIKSLDKVLTPEEEARLLGENYDLRLGASEKVAGRDAWALELAPKGQGKPRQILMVDKQTSVVLSNRRYLPGGGLAAVTRFSKFEPKPQADELFSLPQDTATAVDHQADLDYMTPEDLDRALGEPSHFPKTLAGGFVFESADFFSVRGETVKHARYTDGLAVISLFQTRKPVRLPAQSVSGESDYAHPFIRMSVAGQVLRVKGLGRHFTIIGDASSALLNVIASDLEKILSSSARPK